MIIDVHAYKWFSDVSSSLSVVAELLVRTTLFLSDRTQQVTRNSRLSVMRQSCVDVMRQSCVENSRLSVMRQSCVENSRLSVMQTVLCGRHETVVCGEQSAVRHS